jgi:hypothetical protein
MQVAWGQAAARLPAHWTAPGMHACVAAWLHRFLPEGCWLFLPNPVPAPPPSQCRSLGHTLLCLKHTRLLLVRYRCCQLFHQVRSSRRGQVAAAGRLGLHCVAGGVDREAPLSGPPMPPAQAAAPSNPCWPSASPPYLPPPAQEHRHPGLAGVVVCRHPHHLHFHGAHSHRLHCPLQPHRLQMDQRA